MPRIFFISVPYFYNFKILQRMRRLKVRVEWNDVYSPKTKQTSKTKLQLKLLYFPFWSRSETITIFQPMIGSVKNYWSRSDLFWGPESISISSSGPDWTAHRHIYNKWMKKWLGRRKILFWKLYGYLKFMSCDIVSSKIKIYFINLKTFTMINILDRFYGSS